MTALRTLVRAAEQALSAAGVPSPRFDAEELAAHVFGVRRGELVRFSDADDATATRFRALIERRAQREPLQHITGVAHFRHVTLRVGPGVFIPRPETELVAGAAIDVANRLAAPIVVDLYSGSGAIAIAVAQEVPHAVVHAVEGDALAFDWLLRNVAEHAGGDNAPEQDGDNVPDHTDGQMAARLAGITTARGGRLHAYLDDVAGCVDGALRNIAGIVDVVVANPPYIPTGAHIRDAEVAEHDPAPALWSGDDGLDAMRVTERVATRLLRPGGTVIAEHADLQGESAPQVFRARPQWADVTDHHDLAGRPRYLTATRTNDR